MWIERLEAQTAYSVLPTMFCRRGPSDEYGDADGNRYAEEKTCRMGNLIRWQGAIYAFNYQKCGNLSLCE